MYMDPIDISSSDSEDEIFQPTRNGISFQLLPSASVVPRKLPTWASPFNLNSNIIVRHSTSTPLRNSNDIINDKASNQHGSEFTQREELIQEYTERVSAAFSNVVNSKCLPESSIDHIPVIEIRASAPSTSFQMTQGKLGPNLEHEVKNQLNFTKTSDGNDEWGVEYNHFESPEHSVSQNMAKRILPHSFQTSISISEKQIEGGNQYVHGNDTNLLVSAKKRVLEENDDDIMIYEKFSPGRHLPSSLVHGKSAINLKPVSSSAAPYHSRIVEDGPIQNDERLIFQTAVQDLSQPRLEVDVPDGLLNVALLRHQKIALAWMLQKETTVFPCLGGILADDQGLGKTISTIALIQMQMSLQSKHTSGTPHDIETEPLNLEEDDGSILESNGLKKTTEEDVLNNHTISDTKKNNFHKGRPTAGTLVVCPASVLWQWARELDEKITNAAKLSVLIYHGNRTKDPSELATYDVVLTTYSIVTNEVPKQPLVDDADAERKAEKYGLYSDFIGRKKKECNEGKKGKKNRKGNDGLPVDPESGPLAKVGWFRVVLDEAQTIKNHRTLVARACSTLRAKRRWCLSGTPIQNTIDDLYSYFRFLRYDPYSVYKCFCLSIKYPITRNSACGYKKLQAILKTIMLRRTKETIIDGESIIKLPKKSIYLKKVDFTEEERTFYTRLEADSRSQFKKYAAEGTVTQNYANILLMLLRLRQACDHPLLVKDCLSHSVGQASLTMAKTLPREKLNSLLIELEGSLPICGVCNVSFYEVMQSQTYDLKVELTC